jgi:L-asparagine transporter-like permease
LTEPIEDREAGLERALSSRLLITLALGQSIGTGLFLGSGISVRMAGPGVVISYIVGAGITFLVIRALSEMTAAHPVAGSFGAYAELFLNPFAGWVTRYTYCMAQLIAVGSQILAVSIYCRYWLPGVPAWVWIAGFSIILILINALQVGNFGELEFWFSLVKILAIILFLIFGFALFAGVGIARHSLENYTAFGGFLPNGWAGVWSAVTVALFSYYGLEAAALGSGEAKEPGQTVPRALRCSLGTVALFYTVSLTILVGVVPWNTAGIDESPFVRVYRLMGIPAAAAVMNFVVLTAALSSLNSNLYVTARMIFSLARSGQAPAGLGRLRSHGVPLNAVLASGGGLVIAAGLQHHFADIAYVYMLGAALFGAIFCWAMIFIAHFGFRRGGPFPKDSLIGLLLLLSVLVTMAFIPEMRNAWVAGIPWLAFISLIYLVFKRKSA